MLGCATTIDGWASNVCLRQLHYLGPDRIYHRRHAMMGFLVGYGGCEVLEKYYMVRANVVKKASGLADSRCLNPTHCQLVVSVASVS